MPSNQNETFFFLQISVIKEALIGKESPEPRSRYNPNNYIFCTRAVNCTHSDNFLLMYRHCHPKPSAKQHHPESEPQMEICCCLSWVCWQYKARKTATCSESRALFHLIGVAASLGSDSAPHCLSVSQSHFKIKLKRVSGSYAGRMNCQPQFSCLSYQETLLEGLFGVRKLDIQ